MVVIQKSTGTPAPGKSTTSQAGASLPIAGTMPLPEPRPSLETKVADAAERMISKVEQNKRKARFEVDLTSASKRQVVQDPRTVDSKQAATGGARPLKPADELSRATAFFDAKSQSLSDKVDHFIIELEKVKQIVVTSSKSDDRIRQIDMHMQDLRMKVEKELHECKVEAGRAKKEHDSAKQELQKAVKVISSAPELIGRLDEIESDIKHSFDRLDDQDTVWAELQKRSNQLEIENQSLKKDLMAEKARGDRLEVLTSKICRELGYKKD